MWLFIFIMAILNFSMDGSEKNLLSNNKIAYNLYHNSSTQSSGIFHNSSTQTPEIFQNLLTQTPGIFYNLSTQTPAVFYYSLTQTSAIFLMQSINESINVISEMSLEMFCELFKVSSQDCSCNNSDLESLCEFIIENETSTIFTCNSRSNMAIGIANALSGTIGLVGNGFIIGFSLISWRELSRFRRLISILAVSDFLFAIIQLIIFIPSTWTCNWVYGLVMCKLLTAGLAASANIAVGFIVIIAVDRYFGIVYLMSSILDKNRIRMVVAINVVAGLLSAVPPLVILQVGKSATCIAEWSNKKSAIYSLCLLLFYYIAPVVALTVMYGNLFFSLKNTYLKTHVLSNEQQKRRLKKNKKTLLIIIPILVCFAVLVLPNRIAWIVYSINGLNNIKITKEISIFKLVSEIPYGFHAAINPVIYSIVDMKFRSHVKHSLCYLKRLASLEKTSSSSI